MLTHVRALTEVEERHVQLGAVIDLLIYSTDVLDDLQDGDKEDESGLIMNQAVMLLPLGLSLLEQLPFERETIDQIRSIHQRLLITASLGQQVDLENRCESAEQYTEMVRLKSGSLLAMAALSGAVAAGVYRQKDLVGVEEYSRHLGIVAQIYNDIQTIYEIEKKSDFRKKRKTLPTIYMLNISDLLIPKYFENKCSLEELVENREILANEFKTSGALSFCHFYIELFKKRFIEEIQRHAIYSKHVQLFQKYIEKE